METEYQHLQPDHTLIADQNHANQLINSFKWLEKLILFMPMWSSKRPLDKSRSKIISAFIIMITIGFLIYFEIYIGVYFLHVPRMYFIMQEFVVICLGIAKLLDLYYYNFNFNFPWYYQSLKNCTYSNKIIHRYKNILLVCLIGTTAFDLTNLIRIYVQSLDDAYLVFIISRIIVNIPLAISVCVGGGIFLKYAMSLNYLSEKLGCGDHEIIKQIFADYSTLYKDYRTDYCWSLKWQIHFTLLGLFVFCWNLTYSLLAPFNDLWIDIAVTQTLISIVFLFLMFIMPASLLTEEFHDFEQLLWKYSELSMMDENVDQNFTTCYYYFIQFALRHPIKVKIGGFEVSRKNVFRFVIYFIMAKAISYSIGYFEYQ